MYIFKIHVTNKNTYIPHKVNEIFQAPDDTISMVLIKNGSWQGKKSDKTDMSREKLMQLVYHKDRGIQDRN